VTIAQTEINPAHGGTKFTGQGTAEYPSARSHGVSTSAVINGASFQTYS
jgi:hypothetical protein